jgi:hypothetical protein
MKAATPKQAVTKKPYSAPRLTTHGKFKDIVQGVGGAKADGGGNPKSRA